MKNILVFFLIALFMDGVFGESVSVMEGDSVTLHTGLSEILKDDVIDWRFKTKLIAQFNMENKKISLYDVLNGRFKDRLTLDSQTGDLTIRNIRTEHTGDYEVSNYYTLKTSFSVSVVSAAAVKSVSVLVRDSVTLQTGLTDIQRDAVIQWRYDKQKSPVAEINRMAGIFNTSSDGPDGRFRDGLKLDNQTGSLTIKKMRNTHSGDYEVEIISTSSRYTTHHTQSFTVTVSDAVKSLSVTEGNSVTLQTDVTEIQKDDLIQWMFRDIKLAEIFKADQRFSTYDGPDGRFRDRLKLDNQTGSLTIRDTRTTDSGLYELKISSNRHIINRRITVTVVDAVKSLSVMKGNSVTLQTDVTEIQKDDQILWMFGAIVIAEIYKADQRFFTSDGPAERFRDRLKLDNQTGSLTITNTRITDSGLYEVKISSSRHTINRRITVTVIDAVKSLSVMKGNSVNLQTKVTEIQKDDQILWMFGDTIIAEIYKADQRFFTFDGPDERFRDRLQLDHQTGSLNITDTRITDSGLYEVKISSSRHTINRRITVTVEPVLYPTTKALIGVGVGVVGVLLVAVVAAVVIYRCNKISQPKWSWKTLSVIEGETVPLYPSDTEIIKEDNIRWLFNKSPLAEIKRKSPAPVNVLHENFKGRLDWPGNLGPLNIKNIRFQDSGLYELQIIRTENNIQTLDIFMVVVFAKTDDIKTKEVKEGGSVTLESGVTGIQKDDEILWKFGLDIPIAAIQGGKKKTPPFGADWRSIFRLKLDWNGSLTIRNVGRLHAGFYALHITRSGNASLHLFRVKISNSEVIYIKEHTPSEDNGEVESLYKKMGELSEPQLCKSAESDTENSPILKTEDSTGNEENEYDSP